jgi:hypothetical protein
MTTMYTTTAPTESLQASHAPIPASGRGLLRAMRLALQWRLMLLWLLGLLLPALVASLPVWRMFGAAFDHTVNAAAYARRLDLVALTDLVGLHPQFASALGSGAVVALLLTLLLSPLLTGAAITAARAPAPLGFAALVAGGVHEYGRMLRTLLWAIVPLGLAGFLAGIGTGAVEDHAAAAVLESSATNAQLGAAIFTAVLLLLAHATLDLGRAQLALERHRSSAVLAWVAGLSVLLRRPLAVLGFYFAVTIVGLGLAGLLAVARINVPALGAGSLLGGLLLAQLAVLALAWMRCARLFGLMELARPR